MTVGGFRFMVGHTVIADLFFCTDYSALSQKLHDSCTFCTGAYTASFISRLNFSSSSNARNFHLQYCIYSRLRNTSFRLRSALFSSAHQVSGVKRMLL